MKTYNQFILEVNKHREQKLLFQYKDVTNPKPPVKPLDILKQKKGLKTAQLAPLKSNFVGPNLESLPHMDLRGLERKMKSVRNQVQFYDSKWGRMQGGPPKGP